MSFDVSMTSEIARFMTETVSRRAAPKAVPDLSARKLRRKTVRDIVAALTKILDAEENYLSNIPENLQSGPAYAASEQTSESLSEAIECLSEAYQ
jgi:hypothetical protein